MSPKPKILILINHYLPGFHYGGPIRSIANIVNWLGEEFDFKILTKDHDLNSNTPYPNLTSGQWYNVGKAQVRYLSQQEQQFPNLLRIFSQIDYDILYLNIVFSALTIETLSLSRIGLLPKKPIILAPRGTLNASALKLKSSKKSIFLSLARRIGLYNNLIWHATTREEVTEIANVFGTTTLRQIHCIANLPAPIEQVSTSYMTSKLPGVARIVFLSRIDPMKNLLFALECLGQIKSKIVFDIYGPIKDEGYWLKCQTVIAQLPQHIQVNYKGPVSAEDVPKVLKEYHLFFLPTLNENFGHAIIEALCAGCPILISDRTPWNDAVKHGTGWALPLEKPELFIGALQTTINMGTDEFTRHSNLALNFGLNYLQTTSSIDEMREFLRKIAHLNRGAQTVWSTP